METQEELRPYLFAIAYRMLGSVADAEDVVQDDVGLPCMETHAPIEYEYRLGCSAERAFVVYTERIGEWWDPRYTANADTLESVTIEPCAGGRVYATHGDTGEHDWGEITGWEPGRRLAHTFHLAQDPEHPSDVSVEFASAEDGGCVVRLAHGGWTEANVDDRKKFGDWPVLLDRFAALADSSA